MSVVIWHGDCRKVLATMEPDSIDACVTDPPYALGTISKRYGPGQQPTQHPVYARITRGFMGATWDTDVAFQPETWAAVWRVLKPGAALLAFGGTRTYHRLATAIEAAGFVVYDALTWHYGQGFAKTRNSLKPATELIAYARKPISERSVAANVERHGVGGLNVDDSRINGVARPLRENAGLPDPNGDGFGHKHGSVAISMTAQGRWPSNVLFTHSPSCREVGTRKVRSGQITKPYQRHHVGGYSGQMPLQASTVDHAEPDGTETISRWECEAGCPVCLLDEQAGERSSGMMRAGQQRRASAGGGGYHGNFPDEATQRGTYGDTGGASRFFTVTNWAEADLDTARFRYTAKASSAERREGLAGRTGHATVKPVSIMAWLVGLVTPPGGTVLDPFFGSGTTGIAAQGLGRDISCIGIEQERRWVDDARDRIGMFAEVRETTDGAT